MRKKIFAIMTALFIAAGSTGLTRDFSILSDASEDGFVYSEDTWGFSSDELIDGENPYLTTTLRRRLLTQFGEDETARFKTALTSPVEDMSYGFSVLAMLCHEGIWGPADISDTAQSLHEVQPPVRKDVMVGWINYYNMLQYTDDIVFLDETAFGLNDSSASLTAAASAAASGTAVMRLRESETSSPVTLLIYGTEHGSWKYSGTEYTSRILAADPMNTQFSEDACLYYNIESGEWTIPQKGMSSETGAQLGAVIDDAELLNFYGYDPAKLPRMMLQDVVVHPGQWDNYLTMVQSGIPEAMGISFDIDLCPAAEKLFIPSYSSNSYEVGSGLPMVSCTVHTNDDLLICTSVMSGSNGIICADNEPVVSFVVDTADADTIESVMAEYNIPLQENDELGKHYVLPMYLNTEGMSSYYTDIYETDEFPLIMNGEIYVVMEPEETTTTTTTTTAITTTTTSRITTTTTESTTPVITTTTTTSSVSSTISSVSSTLSSVTTTSRTTSAYSKTTTTTTTSAKPDTTTTTTTTIGTTPPDDTSTTSTPATSVTTTASTTRQSFKWGEDNWSMSYDSLGLQYIADGYRLMEEHSENLSASLNAMERVRIRKAENSEWLGAEYGMTVTEILAKSGIFSVSMWDPSAKYVYSLDLSDERNLSLISYYQLLQESDAVQQELAWTTAYMTQKSVLSSLIDKAEAAGDGGNMAIAAFFSSGYSHSVIAYDVEYGSWQLGDKMYDGRILVADPYLDEFSNEACLYFSSSTLNWTVPMWSIGNDTGCTIGLASDSVSMMNTGGYFMGTASYVNPHPFIPVIEVPADSKEFALVPVGTDDTEAVQSADLDWYSMIASLVTHNRAGLDYLADGYDIIPADDGTVSYQMSYEDCLISVRADNADKITMMADGSVTLMGDDSFYELSLAADSELPWEYVSLSGSGCSILSMEYYDEGILIQGDSLAGALITADDPEGSVSRKLQSMTDGTDYTAAYIYSDSDENICVMVDTDNDGECETHLVDSQTQPESVFYGDVNLDGIVSMLDLVALSRYLGNIIILNEEALMNADCDESLRINAVDAQVLLRFLVLDMPALPLSAGLELLEKSE